MNLTNGEISSLSVPIVKGSVILGFWNSVAQFVSIFNAFFIIYLLSVYEYGVYQLVFSVVAISRISLAEGLDSVILNDITRELGAKNRFTASRIFFEYILIRVLLGIIGWLILILFSYFAQYYFAPLIIRLFWISSFLIIFYVLQSIVFVFLKANLEFSLLGKFSVISEGIKLVLLIFCFYILNFRGIEMIIVSSLGALGLTVFFYLWSLFPAIKKWFRDFPRSENLLMKKIIKTYGKWAILTDFFANFQSSLKLWVIKWFLGTEAVAVYNVAESMVGYLSAPIPFKRALGLVIPRIITNRARVSNLFVRGVKYSTIMYLIIAVLGFIFVPIVVNLFLPKYASSLPLFKIMIIVFIFSGMGLMAKTTLFSLRKQKFIFQLSVLKTILILTLNMVFLPVFGILGAAMSYVFSQFILIVIKTLKLREIYKNTPFNFRPLFIIDDYDKLFIRRFYRKGLNYLKNHRLFVK